MKKICESCGMPMTNPGDFGGGNIENKYCVYCTDKNGALKPFDQKLEEMAGFIMKNTDVSNEKAIEMAKENMAKQPAWKNQF